MIGKEQTAMTQTDLDDRWHKHRCFQKCDDDAGVFGCGGDADDPCFGDDAGVLGFGEMQMMSFFRVGFR